jgi:hypothetical protein
MSKRIALLASAALITTTSVANATDLGKFGSWTVSQDETTKVCMMVAPDGDDHSGGPMAMILPSGAEAMDEPFCAFPSWFLRIECDRCGKTQFLNESHFTRGELPLQLILKHMRHEDCGGRPATPRWSAGSDRRAPPPRDTHVTAPA